ncbi:MAG: alpha/beta hydrolase fold domain-containing protein [Candidatus Saccharibacteria bacterium]|nr:alpha/beta hydrolase fold domain-containing protein [Microbacteriaceae bacterium]
MGTDPRLVFDAELRAALAVVGGVFPPTITPELIPFMRRSYASAPRDDLIAGRSLEIADVSIAVQGATMSGALISRSGTVDPVGCVYLLHSGGLMFGDPFSGLDDALEWVMDLGIRIVTVGYRLAPEHPHPTPFDDCYSGLEWVFDHADELGIREDRIIIGGASAGGGLAAAVALAARDRGGPALHGQLLDYPMLDDRGTASTRLFDGIGVWDRVSNETGWNALLQGKAGEARISPYAAPSRATDFSGLPPAFIDVGAAEIFRDEAIDYARAIWAANGEAELHVWPGAFHACDIFAPHTGISRRMIRARRDWLRRMLVD